jgi:hypothetical protein
MNSSSNSSSSSRRRSRSRQPPQQQQQQQPAAASIATSAAAAADLVLLSVVVLLLVLLLHSHQALRASYTGCVDAFHAFRQFHVGVATKYVIRPRRSAAHLVVAASFRSVAARVHFGGTVALRERAGDKSHSVATHCTTASHLVAWCVASASHRRYLIRTTTGTGSTDFRSMLREAVGDTEEAGRAVLQCPAAAARVDKEADEEGPQARQRGRRSVPR